MLVRETFGKFLSGLFLGLGYFWPIWDRESQAWHDKIAGTLVVRNLAVAAVDGTTHATAVGPSVENVVRQPAVAQAPGNTGFCPSCSTPVPVGSRFCEECGSPLT